MKWLTNLRTLLGHDEPPTRDPNPNSKDEAVATLENARQALNEAERRKEAIHEVSSSLQSLRRRNHFGESIELAMRRKERHA